jgi:cell division protein FtsB
MRFVQHWLSIVAFVVLLISLYRFVEGFQNWQEARAIKRRFHNEIAELERKRDQLQLRIEKLRTDELTKERLARRVGYIKPGETVYKIVRSSQPSPVISSPTTRE